MKTLFAMILVTLFSFCTLAQTTTYGNFKLADQQIIYQKVFSQDSISIAKLEKYYKAQTFISNFETKGDGVQFDMNDISVDYKKFQFSQVSTHIVMQTGKFSGKVAIAVKEGKYRITVSAIQFTGNLGYKLVKEKDDLTSYATKNSGTLLSEDWCKPNVLGLLDKAFTDKLEVRKTSDEW